MATLPPTAMLDWLEQHQFLTSIQTAELRPQLSRFPDSHALAKELIVRDWLTPFQVNQILQGKQDQLILGDYRLRERLGEGAMGQIYKAWHLRLGRIVAIKTIHKEFVSSPKAMDRFRREIETASKLDHPNIALVRDAGESEGRPFLVMDFIDGFNLSAHVKQQGALPITEAVEYARQAALGLQHAHERGIVHRDIKPSNLIVATTKLNGEPTPLVKILDFGLARFEVEQENSPRLTQVGNLLGTIDYVAPEQAQNAHTADIRADIYSLGCTLYYLLTAQPPFGGTTVVEKLGPRLTGDPPSARAIRAEIPETLDTLLRKLMARRPDDRYQTPIEVAQALEPFVAKAATPVMAQPVAANAIVAGSVPMAMPIAPAPVAEEPAVAEDPAFLGMTATGRDMSTGPAAAAPPTPKPSRSFPLKLMALVGGGIATLLVITCAGVCLMSGYFGDPAPKRDPGTIRITNAKFSTQPPVVRAGDRKRVLVYIERDRCKEPIKLSLHDLPEDVRSEPTLIPGTVNSGEIIFTVRFGTEPMEQPIRVVAENSKGDVRAETTLLLKIVP